MEGPWFGIVIMTAMVVGLVWWIWHTVRSDKKEKE
jgi:heme/copper-type cytochrome/quinol oxidase subunit 4